MPTPPSTFSEPCDSKVYLYLYLFTLLTAEAVHSIVGLVIGILAGFSMRQRLRRFFRSAVLYTKEQILYHNSIRGGIRQSTEVNTDLEVNSTRTTDRATALRQLDTMAFFLFPNRPSATRSNIFKTAAALASAYCAVALGECELWCVIITSNHLWLLKPYSANGNLILATCKFFCYKYYFVLVPFNIYMYTLTVIIIVCLPWKKG